jgi:hypothetical protein
MFWRCAFSAALACFALSRIFVRLSRSGACRYRKGEAKSLARIVADLINDNEPLLKAEADQATVTVRERGGPGAFSINVCPRKERQ